MIYREIVEQDIPDIIDLRGKTRENPYSIQDLKDIGITHASIAQDLKSHLKGFLCEDNDNIVGFAMGKRDTGEMWVIAISPDYENKGVGKKLLSMVEEWLFQSGCNELWLTTGNNPKKRAYGFYLKQGWIPSEIKNHLRYMRKSK